MVGGSARAYVACGIRLLQKMKFIDIGANLTDPMFRGLYHGSQKHKDDLESVLARAASAGVEKIIITGGSLDDSKEALQLANTKPCLYSTVGCHPTRCLEFEKDDADEYLARLAELAANNKGKVVAIGECGLDYDRTEFCPKDVQRRYFERQLDIAEATKLPLFLHCRNAASDLIEVLRVNQDRLQGGVVHSFDGSREEAASILDLGFHIGINGCSLKTAANLETIATIPKDKLMLETDAPWCEVRPTHAGWNHVKTKWPSVKKEKWSEGSQVKGRNEPTNIVHVLEIVSVLLNEDPAELADIVYGNTRNVFFPE